MMILRLVSVRERLKLVCEIDTDQDEMHECPQPTAVHQTVTAQTCTAPLLNLQQTQCTRLSACPPSGSASLLERQKRKGKENEDKCLSFRRQRQTLY
jgi:hypothetical protein